jgi:hypothetical protein
MCFLRKMMSIRTAEGRTDSFERTVAKKTKALISENGSTVNETTGQLIQLLFQQDNFWCKKERF